MIDVTEIFNLLNWEKKQRLFKLVYLVVLLFLSIFWYFDLSTLKLYENVMECRAVDGCTFLCILIAGWFGQLWRMMIDQLLLPTCFIPLMGVFLYVDVE